MLADAVMKPLHPSPRRDVQTTGERKLVLYVEDEESNRKVALMRLGRAYDILLAASDREACELLRDRGQELYAVLMDIELKGSTLNGIQLTMLLRGRLSAAETPAFAQNFPVLPELPVLFVSAYSGRYTEKELLGFGGNRLISKPVNFVELANAITFMYLDRIRST